MALTQVVADLIDLLETRGYSHQGNAVLSEHLEGAGQELWHEARWDFRRIQIAGAAPLDVGEPGVIVKHVRATADNRQLVPITESDHYDLTQGVAGGQANSYYIPDDFTVYLSPTSTESITVIAYSALPWENGSFAPSLTISTRTRIPQAYVDVLVLLAEVRAMRADARHDEADALRGGPEYQSRIAQMKEEMLTDQADAPRRILPKSLY